MAYAVWSCWALAAPLTQAAYGLLVSVADFFFDWSAQSLAGDVCVGGVFAAAACARVAPTTHAANGLLPLPLFVFLCDIDLHSCPGAVALP